MRHQAKLLIFLITGASLITGAMLVIAAPLLPRTFLPIAIHQQTFESPLISEVLFDPAGAEPDGEWIELYNPSRLEFDLSEVKIGDAWLRGEAEGMAVFPQGATLVPGQVIVIANSAAAFTEVYGFLPDYELLDTDPVVPDMLKYSAWATHAIELTNTGDEVLMLGEGDRLVDALSWGSSKHAFDPSAPRVDENHSLERRPIYRDTDQAKDWFDQPEPNPGSVDLGPPTPLPTRTASATTFPTQVPTGTPLPCGQAPLLVSEVLYDPDGTEPAREWIELYNPSGDWINLSCLRLGDEETPGEQEGMFAFPEGSILMPGEVIVIANRAADFVSAYGFVPDFEFQSSLDESPDLLKDAGWSGGNVDLANLGDEVLILNQSHQLIDAVSWGDSAFEQPPVDGVAEGHSLERYPAWQDSDLPSDWRDQPSPGPGVIDHLESTATPTPTLTATLTGEPTQTETPTPTPAVVVPILVINEILGDPDSLDGDANGDGIIDANEDDFLELVNMSGAPVDLTGWSVHDGLAHRHLFPPGSIVADGCAVLIFGGGTPVGEFGNSLVQTASSDGLYFNYNGDIVTLLDPDANVVATYTYYTEGGYNQSLTRDPDIIGEEPLVWHTTADGSNGALFSPGTKIDGSCFSGCGCGNK